MWFQAHLFLSFLVFLLLIFKVPAGYAFVEDRPLVELQKNLMAVGDSCKPLSQQRGLHCRGVVTGYPQPVHIFMPFNFLEKSTFDLVIHIHGHNLFGTALETHFNVNDGTGDFARFLGESSRNAILIAPESLDKNQTHRMLQTIGGLNGFVDEVIAKMTSVGIANMLQFKSLFLTGHSGASSVLTPLLQEQPQGQEARYFERLQGVGFFDAGYGQQAAGIARGVRLIEAKPNAKFISLFLSQSATDVVNSEVARLLSKAVSSQFETDLSKRVQLVRLNGFNHMQVMMDGRYSSFLRFQAP